MWLMRRCAPPGFSMFAPELCAVHEGEFLNMRILVTGGAGFLGSHLCRALLARGDSVVCVDNLSTGEEANVADLTADPRFTFVLADITTLTRQDLGLDVTTLDAVAHLASPASPPDYHRLPLETLRVGSAGTEAALELAREAGARFVLASTSEVYGDPQVHPQRETYWGNVNPIGRRSVYDESKRYAEAITMAYQRVHGVNVGIVRIFNTYGPMMRPHDGRVVTSFITQALTGTPLTIYGDGGQTRSFCFVDDLVRGLTAMLDADHRGPINLGNPNEQTVAELAASVLTLTESSSRLERHPPPQDDPTRRKPDIGQARELLGWEPQVSIEEGLARTVEWFRSRSLEDAALAVAGPQYEGETHVAQGLTPQGTRVAPRGRAA